MNLMTFSKLCVKYTKPTIPYGNNSARRGLQRWRTVIYLYSRGTWGVNVSLPSRYSTVSNYHYYSILKRWYLLFLFRILKRKVPSRPELPLKIVQNIGFTPKTLLAALNSTLRAGKQFIIGHIVYISSRHIQWDGAAWGWGKTCMVVRLLTSPISTSMIFWNFVCKFPTYVWIDQDPLSLQGLYEDLLLCAHSLI